MKKYILSIFFLLFIFSGLVSNLHTAIEKNDITNWFNELPFKNQLIEINGLFERCMGKNIVMDVEPQYNVVKLENDYLTFLNTNFDQTNNANSLEQLYQYLKQNNIDFLYVQAPFKISKYADGLPEYCQDYSNINADNLLFLSADVPKIDLREMILADGLNHYDLFFKTDHHWLPSTGLWAAQKILQETCAVYSYQFDLTLLESENYTYETITNCFLGSQGKRVGKYYVGVDDFTIVLPKNDTNCYEINAPNIGYKTSGTFQEVLFNREMAVANNLYNANNYQAYLAIGDGTGLQEIRNLSNTDGPRAVFFRDSFASTVIPFIAQYFSEIDLIDLRYYKENLVTYFNEKKPNIVFVMYNADLLGWNVPFEFVLNN